MRVAILDDYTGYSYRSQAFAKLEGHDVKVLTTAASCADELVEWVHDREALVSIRGRSLLTADVIDRLPALRMISHIGSFPNIDLEACTRNGVVLSSSWYGLGGAGFPHSSSPAELTWGLVLASVRQLPQQVAALKEGIWQLSIGTSLRGLTLGVYGYKNLGSEVAAYGRAFGMKVQVWGREGSLSRGAADGYEIPPSREAFFETSDVVCLHVMLVEGTKGIITAEDLASMKPSALIVNTSRAALIEPGALVAALEAGRPGWAAVDVYESEPVRNGDHPLLKMPNVICTPHLGYATCESLDLILGRTFDQVVAYAAGEPMSVINPEALQVGRPALS